MITGLRDGKAKGRDKIPRRGSMEEKKRKDMHGRFVEEHGER